MEKETVLILPANEKLVVFFDEMPWMATKKSGFLAWG